MYRTVFRLALDHLRVQKRRAHYESQAPQPDPIPGPDAAIHAQQRQARVRHVLATLKRDRAALLILRSEGYSLNEMAAIVGVKPGSVGTMLARADAAFRKEYVKRYGEE